MLARIIFFAAVTAATLAVILLPLLSPVPRKSSEGQPVALSLYIHPPGVGSRPHHRAGVRGNTAFVFRHELREGPGNTSRVVGRARGLVVPARGGAGEPAAFNIVHLALEAPPAYSGSLSVEARRQAAGHGAPAEELVVVGGTGAFTFARGFAAFTPAGEAIYRLDLRLRFPRAEDDSRSP